MPGGWSDTPAGMSADLRVRCEGLWWGQAPCRVGGARLCTGGAGSRDQKAEDAGFLRQEKWWRARSLLGVAWWRRRGNLVQLTACGA